MNAEQKKAGVAAVLKEISREPGAPDNSWGIITEMFPDATSDEKFDMINRAYEAYSARAEAAI